MSHTIDIQLGDKYVAGMLYLVFVIYLNKYDQATMYLLMCIGMCVIWYEICNVSGCVGMDMCNCD